MHISGVSQGAIHPMVPNGPIFQTAPRYDMAIGSDERDSGLYEPAPMSTDEPNFCFA